MNKPAFPRPVTDDELGTYDDQQGMTLLEYFTGQALPSVLADITCYHNPEKGCCALF